VLLCVMCFIVVCFIILYGTVLCRPALQCSTLPHAINPFAVNNNNNNSGVNMFIISNCV
jgi:hypothetical protein